MRLGFCIIGAMKAATTTLASMLARHPGVVMADPKEPGFLSRDERYERVVADPEAEMRRVCDFIVEGFNPAMVTPGGSVGTVPRGQVLNNPGASTAIVGRSIGRWRGDLAPAERREFVDLAGELLVSLGNASDHGWVHE